MPAVTEKPFVMYLLFPWPILRRHDLQTRALHSPNNRQKIRFCLRQNVRAMECQFPFWRQPKCLCWPTATEPNRLHGLRCPFPIPWVDNRGGYVRQNDSLPEKNVNAFYLIKMQRLKAGTQTSTPCKIKVFSASLNRIFAMSLVNLVDSDWVYYSYPNIKLAKQKQRCA